MLPDWTCRVGGFLTGHKLKTRLSFFVWTWVKSPPTPASFLWVENRLLWRWRDQNWIRPVCQVYSASFMSSVSPVALCSRLHQSSDISRRFHKEHAAFCWRSFAWCVAEIVTTGLVEHQLCRCKAMFLSCRSRSQEPHPVFTFLFHLTNNQCECVVDVFLVCLDFFILFSLCENKPTTTANKSSRHENHISTHLEAEVWARYEVLKLFWSWISLHIQSMCKFKLRFCHQQSFLSLQTVWIWSSRSERAQRSELLWPDSSLCEESQSGNESRHQLKAISFHCGSENSFLSQNAVCTTPQTLNTREQKKAGASHATPPDPSCSVNVWLPTKRRALDKSQEQLSSGGVFRKSDYLVQLQIKADELEEL